MGWRSRNRFHSPGRAALIAAALLGAPDAVRAEDPRQLVSVPEAVLQGMLGHMSALDSIMSSVATERFEQAARMADERLRVGPFDPQEEDRFPPAMRDAGDSLRDSSKRLAMAIRRVNADHSYLRMRKVTAALGEVVATCNMCHAHYRFR